MAVKTSSLTSTVTPNACVACGGPLAFFGSRKNYRYDSCTACGSLQLVPQPTRDELLKAYQEEYATAEHITSDGDWCHRISQGYFEAVSRILDKLGVKKVTEIGAGWGVLCDLLIKRGLSYEGVEPSRRMADYCHRRGFPIKLGDIDNLQGRDRDAIVLTNVFEHLVERDQWLEQARKLLPAGGYFVSSQPTAGFAALMGNLVRAGVKRLPLPDLHQEFSPPWHTTLFSIKGMKKLFARHGFDLIEVAYAPPCHERGLVGLAQRSLEVLNNAGWKLFGIRWPLIIVHIFVFRKKND